jgi:hypothetical protein
MTIGIYIIAGLVAVNLLSILNRESRRYWKDCLSIAVTGVSRKSKERKNILIKIGIFIFYLLAAFIMFACLLVIAPIATIDSMLRGKSKLEITEEDYQLYFHHDYQHVEGTGTIFCYDCDYNEDIVFFLHGINDADWGYQCQSCGKFHTLNNSQKTAKPLVCSCGGQLSREEALFCPQCKSKSIRYNMAYIT